MPDKEIKEIPSHFIHEITTKGHEAIDVNLFPRISMRFSCQKTIIRSLLYYYSSLKPILRKVLDKTLLPLLFFRGNDAHLNDPISYSYHY